MQEILASLQQQLQQMVDGARRGFSPVQPGDDPYCECGEVAWVRVSYVLGADVVAWRVSCYHHQDVPVTVHVSTGLR